MADCLHPVTIRNKGKGPAWIAVPCGECPRCLATKLNKWVFRLKQHCKDFKFVSFVTLTYSNEKLPYYAETLDDHTPRWFIGSGVEKGYCDSNYFTEPVPALDKKELQYFFRKLRKFYKHHISGLPATKLISYYAIGEYGLDYDRPHYHMILFSNYIDFKTPEFLYLLDSLWNNGFVDVKQVTDVRIQYVCKHHLKPKNSKWFPVKQFTLRSNGLGLGFLNKDVVRWFKDNKPTVIHQRDGVKIGVPRYYRTKLMEMYGIDTSVAYIQRKTPQQKLHESYSGETLDRVFANRKIYEEHLENQNLYKSKNKRK